MAVTCPVTELICMGTPPNILLVVYGDFHVIVEKGGFTGTGGQLGTVLGHDVEFGV